MIEKFASAVWKGSLKEGAGTLTAQSGAFSDLPYTFATRFEDRTGANPEELIAAAHAGCYSMFLSAL
ncbi:MAG: OsmC family peroxiredoxin, partial [Albidovulum sp.]